MATVALVAVVATGMRDGPNGSPVAWPAPSPSVVETDEPRPSPVPSSPTPASPAGAATAAPVRVEAPSVGLSAAVLPITPTGSELDPPTFTDAYWIAEYGRPGSDNTTYIAGHSATRGTAIFDALFDQARQRTLIAAGDPVIVTTSEGRYTYEVSSTARYPKGELASTGEVWDAVPGRLVLITCFQRADGGASRDNLVVYADLVDGQPAA